MIELPPQPAGYCTWYHARASDEKQIVEQAEFAAKHLKPFGFSVVQIDDGWQDGAKSKNGPKKVFSRAAEKGPYPHGMKPTAEAIAAQGLVAGLWFMPFAGTHDDPFFKEHQDWFVKQADGTPYDTKWGGTCLDMTHPGAREYLRENVARIRDWGYRYFKMDGMWTGTATKQIYVNDAYKPDGMGDAVFHDPNKTNIEAYRDGLKLIRETAGRDVFILGCCAPQNMRSYGGAFGLVDAMRIGPDNGPGWSGLLRGPTYGSRHYHLHGRIWYNDPDPVYVREKVPLEHARDLLLGDCDRAVELEQRRLFHVAAGARGPLEADHAEPRAAAAAGRSVRRADPADLALERHAPHAAAQRDRAVQLERQAGHDRVRP